MKKIILIFNLCIAGLLPLSAQTFQDSIRAFPEAEGFGAYVTGGRGGRVVYVTHTGDATNVSDPLYKGSLREALATPGTDPITIAFKCGGIIELKASSTSLFNMKCPRSNMTIAGQTALGDGICIKGYGIGFSGTNVIIRHLRFRPGDTTNTQQSCLWFENGGHFIIDHCSFSWAVEESMTVYDNDYSTVQWCLVSESLYRSIHGKGDRGYGAQWGGKNCSYHHNLLAHHNSRMPRQNGARSNDNQVLFDYVNNVHYNWGSSGAFYGGDVELDYVHSNILNNYFRRGPAGPNNGVFVAPSAPAPGRGAGQWWLAENKMVSVDGTTFIAPSANQTSNVADVQYRAASQFAIPGFAQVVASHADTAYKYVLLNVGATYPKRDAIDARIVNEVKTGTNTFTGSKAGRKGIIDSQRDTRPSGADASWDAWGSYYIQVDSAQAPLDTDGDGMPDWYEEAKGFNKNNAADGKARAANKYTNLENYLNSFPYLPNGKQNQLILWQQNFGSTICGGDPVKLNATSSTGLALTYASSNTNVTRVSNDTLYFIGAGTAIISAKQVGNATYNSVESKRSVAVTKGAQSISWAQDLSTSVGGYIVLGATSNRGLPITYTSNYKSIARIGNDTLYAVSVGTAVITAKQDGNVNYGAAASKTQTVTVGEALGVAKQDQFPVLLYPNPASDVINFRFDFEDIYNVMLVDMAGRVVSQTTISAVFGSMNIAGCVPGSYSIVVENSKQQRTVKKIIVNK